MSSGDNGAVSGSVFSFTVILSFPLIVDLTQRPRRVVVLGEEDQKQQGEQVRKLSLIHIYALDSGVNGAQKGGADLAAGAADVDDNMTMLNAGLSELNAAATALPDAADALNDGAASLDRKSTRLNSSHSAKSRMPSSA